MNTDEFDVLSAVVGFLLGGFVPVKIDGTMTHDLTAQVELKHGRVITLEG